MVSYLPEAEEERQALPARERAALINADRKLMELGPRLGEPHRARCAALRRLCESCGPDQGTARIEPCTAELAMFSWSARSALMGSPTLGGSSVQRSWRWNVLKRWRMTYNNERIQ